METLALAFGAGLMAIGLSILAFLWKTRASRATEQSEAAHVNLPGRLDEAPAAAALGIVRPRVGETDPAHQSQIYELAQQLAMAATAAEKEARTLEGNATDRSLEIIARAEQEAQRIGKKAAQEAQQTVQAAVWAANHLQVEARTLTETATSEISSAATALNGLVTKLTQLNGHGPEDSQDHLRYTGGAGDDVEPGPVTRSLKDEVKAVLTGLNDLRRGPNDSAEGPKGESDINNGTHSSNGAQGRGISPGDLEA